MNYRVRYSIAALMCTVVLSACLSAAQVLAQTPLISLFEGEPSDQRTVSIGSWGGADVSEATDFSLLGRMSIKAKTSNLYQGVRVDLLKPVDVGKALANPHAYLQIAVYSTKRTQGTNINVTDPRAGPKPPTGAGPKPPTGYGPGTGTTPEQGYSPISEVRLILFFAEGALVVDRQRVEPYRQDEAGWTKFNIPIAKFMSQEALPGYHLKRVVMCGNADDTVYIGEIRLVDDNSAIIVGVGEDYEIWKGMAIGMVAVADGGAATLQYEWDFDASDGITVDATGPIAQHTYPETGDYTVTIVVKDVDGIKAPKKIENIVHVVSG